MINAFDMDHIHIILCFFYLQKLICFVNRVTTQVLESKPLPFGVWLSSSPGHAGVSGIVNMNQSLINGQRYVTNTMGTLLASGNFYGTSPLSSYSNRIQNYIEIVDAATIVTFDSTVGMAVSSNDLLLMKN